MVLLVWEDAHGDPTRQVWSLEELVAHQPLIVESLGWILIEDPRGVTLAQERIQNEDGTFSYRGVGFVPRGMIRSVQTLARPRLRPQ